MNEEHETTDVRIYKHHTSKVVCAFKDVAAAEVARALLTKAGFDEDEIESFSGLAGERDLDLDGKYHGVLQHLRRNLEHFMRADALQLDHYERCLLRGNHVIQVHTNHETKDAAHEILKTAGGNHINYYGLLITERFE